MTNTRQVILDTETTGISTRNGDRVIEIGCVEMINRKLTGNVYHQYLNPDREVSFGAYQVHGISNEFLRDKPKFVEVAKGLKAFLKDSELVIHNAPFDVGFLEFEFSLIDDEWETLDQYCDILDTLKLARELHPGQKNNLDALCKRYHINNTHRQKHGALLDAEILAEVYLMMTGGQGDLSLEAKQSQEQVKAAVKFEKVIDLPVIMASQKENEEHQAYLETMQSQGECLWLSMTDSDTK